MRIGICLGVNGIAEAAHAGYDFVELPVGILLPDRDDLEFAPVKEALLAAPLPVEAMNCFLPGQLKVTGADVDLPTTAHYIEVALRRAAAVGVSVVVFGSGGARGVPEGHPRESAWEQLARVARLAGEIGGRYGITIALEPLAYQECNILNLVDEGAGLVDRVNHPNVQLLADIYHMKENDEPYASLISAGTRLEHIHLDTPVLEDRDGGYDYDYPAFFAALLKARYAGRVSVEDHSGMFAHATPPRIAVYRAVREHIEACIDELAGL